MPISMLVTSETSTISWGQVPADALCSSVVLFEANLTVGEEVNIPFTACDDDGLPVATGLPSLGDDRRFTAQRFTAQLSIDYELLQPQYAGDGRYEVRVQVTQHGRGG